MSRRWLCWTLGLSLAAALAVAAWQLYTHRGRNYRLVDDGVGTHRFYYNDATSTQVEDK